MPAHFFYVDESHDDEVFCLSAISVMDRHWSECLKAVVDFRLRLKQQYGVWLREELHTTKLVAGRGSLGPNVICKYDRVKIFFDMLRVIATLPKVFVINVAIRKQGRSDPQLIAWDRMINRIERTMRAREEREKITRIHLCRQMKMHAPSASLVREIESRLMALSMQSVVIADQGREFEITKAFRRMRIFNPVPSKMGQWSSGTYTKNIIVERQIEDPVFKASERSYFIQLADAAAFALLKRETTPSDRVKRYGLHKAWDKMIAPVSLTAASKRDPHGIVRN